MATNDIPVPISVERYASLTAALYNGPLQAEPWDDFLRQLRSICQATLAVTGLRLPRPGDPGVVFVNGVDLHPEDYRDFADRFSALDPLVNLPDCKAVALDDLVPRKKLEQSTFYRAFMKPFNQAQSLGLNLHRGNQVVMFLRVTRAPGDPDFSIRERAILELLAPQLKELLNWIERDQAHSGKLGFYEQTFANLAIATVILDQDLKIDHCNETARQLLATNDGIICVNDKLRITRHRENQQFQHALRELLTQDGAIIPPTILAPRARQSRPLVLTLKKGCSDNSLDTNHRIAVYMSAPEMRRVDQLELIVELFGLTRQEARLVIALINGGTLDSFVEQMNIKKNTARTHLYNAFQKIGVSQQSELVSCVIRTIYGM